MMSVQHNGGLVESMRGRDYVKVLAVRVVLCALLLMVSLPAAAASCNNTAVGSFTCVQSVRCINTSNIAPTCALPSALTASTVLAGGIFWNSTTITLTSITGCGATWTIYDNPVAGGVAQRAASFTGVGGSGSCTVTFNFSSAAISATAMHEVSGADTTAPVGTRHAGSTCNGCGTATDAVTVGPVSAAGTDYIFASTSDFSQVLVINAGTGYNLREQEPNGMTGVVTSEDKSASGSNSATFTDTHASQYNATVMLSIKAAVAGVSVKRRVVVTQ